MLLEHRAPSPLFRFLLGHLLLSGGSGGQGAFLSGTARDLFIRVFKTEGLVRIVEDIILDTLLIIFGMYKLELRTEGNVFGSL